MAMASLSAKAQRASKPLQQESLAEVESRLLSGFAHIGELAPLLSRFTTASSLTPTVLAEARCLRRVFEHLWRTGALQRATLAGEKANAAGSKRKRVEGSVERTSAATKLAHWLRVQFFTFLEQLLRIAAWPEARDAGTEAAAAHAAAQREALDTIVGFAGRACSQDQQAAEHGCHVNGDVIVWLLRHLLTIDTSSGGAGAGGSGDGAGGGWTRAQRRLLADALHTFRSGFCDEFDDVRYYAFRAVAAVARASLATLQGRGGGSAGGSGSEPADAASIAALSACPPALFVRNAAAFLLSVSLPPSEAEWAEAPHRSLVRGGAE